MKVSIFVMCIYFQILLVQCDIFVNNLNESDARIKMCIQKTINHLFSHNDTLTLILNSDLCEDAIFEMNTMRPYIVLNMDVINDVNKLQYDGQFIMCPKDVHSLNRTTHTAHGIAQSNKRGMGNSKIVVISNTTDDATVIFEMFWSYGINNVIILVYGQGIPKLFTCNRFAPENECGKTAKLMMIQHDCEKELSLSFTNVIHQMNKCAVSFAHNIRYPKRNPICRITMYVLEELSHYLNATFQSTVCPDELQLDGLSRNVRMIVISYYNLLDNCAKTEPLLRSDYLWLVPKAKQISNMNAFMKIFNYDVWIATIVVFISVWLTWFLIISRNGGFTFDKLCISFLNVWSLTIFGNVVQYPRCRSLALRILLLFYLFYAINMQFAFTSDMSTVLTAPRYTFQIRNLEELADSQLPIYTSPLLKKMSLSENNTDRKLYTKLKDSVHGVTDTELLEHLFNIHLHGNFAVLTVPEVMGVLETAFNKKVEAYEIRDHLVTGVSTVRLQLPFDHYFTTTFNTFLIRMVESGILDKDIDVIYRQSRVRVEMVPAMAQDDELTLRHVTFIFAFLGIGLLTACVVFCLELVLHKYL